jgi:hypothetical protein
MEIEVDGLLGNCWRDGGFARVGIGLLDEMGDSRGMQIQIRSDHWPETEVVAEIMDI